MGEFMGKRDEYEMMKKKKKKENSSDVVRWEKFLPSMALRILLVESDDSTRQIIAALLRKCSYIVAAVPDGLMAWETLKRRPHNIDLILTEVDLPSISGYALLTLIMEHEICKNIPVIMMSTQDSVSLVLKCMLKGAADFLVKPVRRNELKNLWQHVWRRQTNHQQAVGYVTKDTPTAENKVEATSEDNTSSTHSSDYLVSIEKNKECSEKGSDAQSSCTTPCLEVENAHMPSMQGLSQLKCSSESNLSHAEQEICMGMADKSVLSKSDTGGKSTTSELESASCLIAYNSTAFRMEEDQGCTEEMMREASVGPESRRENTYIASEIHCHTDELVEPSTRAIDLIGNFDNHLPGIYRPYSAYDVMPKFNFAPQLELSLRRFHDDHLKNEGNDEMHSLNHSNVSAFSRYDNKKTLQPLFPTLASNEHSESTTALFVGESGLSEAAFSSPQCGIVPVPGVRFGNICAGYDQPPIVYTQPGYPPAWIPRSVGPQEFSSSEIHSSEQGHSTIDVTINHSADRTVEEEDSYLESGGGLCHGSASKINSSVCGSICDASDGDFTPAAAVARTTASESVNDNRVPIHDGSRGMESNCSTQREAALMKYRLKRKERHFEKKVRYESRKRLAEQRPRVKGQFVRRMQIDPPSSTIDACLT